jgi:hypothetical protein
MSFNLGDVVKVIGPSILEDDKHKGETFTIKGISALTQHYPFDPYDGIYYPISSLKLIRRGKP